MDNSGDETEEDDNEWGRNVVPSAPLERTDVFALGTGLNKNMEPYATHRVILHFDLDCFYAQVEMIRNPALREVPLGVQQKYIIVTCNYVAREQGLTKLMSVADAKEKCPQLVLVNGEDLTHYREMSYKVTELLMSYCPLVERLGFDENFMDITEMVEKRLSETSDINNLCFKGNVYNRYSADVKAQDYSRLAVGSHIAAEIREAMHSRLGLTGCGGIATNKLLAKLVSGTFKPNQQTTLLPENISDIMSCLSSLRKVPGVGHQTSKRLQALGLVSIKDLQLFPLNDLVNEFGAHSAERLKNLVMGIDTSPVTPTGAPQSLSDEDSFKKILTTKDVLEKVQQLLSSLVERMHKDGRQPQTFRLSIRRYSATNKWLSRESRQCPVPYHIGQKITSGGCKDAVVLLVPLAMKLFQKMVNSNSPFHLTLVNVCFSNLQARGAAVTGKGSITAFLTHSTSPRITPMCSPQKQNDSSNSEKNHSVNSQRAVHNNIFLCSREKTLTTKSTCGSQAVLHELKRKWSSADAGESNLQTQFTRTGPNPDNKSHSVSNQMPSNCDPEVLKLLPEDIQQELLSYSYINSLPSTSANSSQPSRISGVVQKAKNTSPDTIIHLKEFDDPTLTVNKPDPLSTGTVINHHRPLAVSECSVTEGRMSFPLSSVCTFPGNVDLKVFSELPLDVQRELMSEWKHQKPVLKVLSSRKPGALPKTKDKKSARKKSQSNSLLNYFKSS